MARFLPADSPAGQWRSSSVVAVIRAESATESHVEAVESAQATQPQHPAAAAARVSTAENPDFCCLVTHEQSGDEAFWNIVRPGAKRYSETATMEYRVVGGPTAAEQSALVRECMNDGAVGIARTLADRDGMANALAEARAAGVVIHSFNSDVLDHARLGSSRHVALAIFEQNHGVLPAIIAGEMLFAIDSSPWRQARFAMSSLTADVYATRILLDNYQLPHPYAIIANVALRLSPEISTSDNARAWLEMSQLIGRTNESSGADDAAQGSE